MSELVKIIGNAIIRDLIYMIGGSVIVASFLYTTGDFPIADMPIAGQLFLAGVSYVLGYAAQEAAGFLGITSTEHPPEPPCLATCLYRHVKHKAWVSISINDFEAADATFAARSDEMADRNIRRVNRIITLKQIGSTMGACGVVSLLFLTVHAAQTEARIDQVLCVGVLIATAIFIAISWVKRLDESSIKVRLVQELNDVPGQDEYLTPHLKPTDHRHWKVSAGGMVIHIRPSYPIILSRPEIRRRKCNIVTISSPTLRRKSQRRVGND